MMARYNPVPEPEVRRTPEIECKTLALAEVTESDASSLLASLATNEKGSSDSTEFSKLTINPERVAKVITILRSHALLNWTFVRWCLSEFSLWHSTLEKSWW